MQVPWNSHRLKTVTIVYSGEVEHRDSSGGGGKISPGDVQWMTAASGLVHAEFHGRDFARHGGVLEMVQLWINLPAKDKMSHPIIKVFWIVRFPPSICRRVKEGRASLRVNSKELQDQHTLLPPLTCGICT
ncbi:Pirin [Nitrosomonas sp. Nm33]|nr:Pirin [Nitrosomonas sp. Nm33]